MTETGRDSGRDSGRGAVLFDRDGVLNVDTGYLHRREDWIWIPGAPEAVASVRARGLLAIVVTNQSGIGRGYYGEDDLHRLHAWVNDDLEARTGARIDAFYHCPCHPRAVVARFRHPDHPDRKPNPGMLLRAIADHGLDPARCLMIGDKDSDMDAARAAGIAGRLYTGGDLRDLLGAVSGPPTSRPSSCGPAS